ncbi:unnamed protein product [Rotaria sordida]|uniref:Uncharacterized protein n=1 Tax=Rotaria sordida TaxID=392033 RepID=A0A818WPX1_9BILA|nr:unnamed protein product [Rotaria sordida]CAF3729077.1 unnamed protein product [Rotaria sordida]
MAEAAASSFDTTQAKSPAISFINSDKEKSLLIFTAGLETRPKQAKTIAIQRRMDNLGKRYYDGAINP